MLERPGLLALMRGCSVLGRRTKGRARQVLRLRRSPRSRPSCRLAAFRSVLPRIFFWSEEEGRLKVCLARLQFEAQERAQACQAEMGLRLEIHRLETEAEK
ncbi:hypothetical protein QQF64_029876 [Cirrhinus molitorella]|uniref:Uncharacterized protein n=1 Tax=Cirrhinus molitorella TaxID=172907 RepID=A0ABR3N1R5_9TELE